LARYLLLKMLTKLIKTTNICKLFCLKNVKCLIFISKGNLIQGYSSIFHTKKNKSKYLINKLTQFYLIVILSLNLVKIRYFKNDLVIWDLGLETFYKIYYTQRHFQKISINFMLLQYYHTNTASVNTNLFTQSLNHALLEETAQ